MPKKSEGEKKEQPSNKAQILREDISTEMRRAYLDYAMSVITSRALPDARDGLKPVQRRILYAMHGMGLRHNVKTRKSAAVVGETLAKYHPHGNTAVYEAMVKMVQPFDIRYPLVIGQGNFGSIDGDSAAAERYTEAKMSLITEKMLEDIDKKTVEFVPNYENTSEEPVVLPTKMPNLLLNGTMGIAVGIATKIPPHNLNEIAGAIIHLIKNPDATTDEILEFIQGPDFPLGAVAYSSDAIRQAYTTGRGGVVVRGEVEVVENGKETSIIITSLPYKVNKATLIEKIGELARNKRIEGIKDLRDESTDDIRIVIDLKQSAQPQRIQNTIYKHTQLEETFHYNLVALLNGVPQILTIHQILQAFIDHRREVVERALRFDLEKARAREHILEGLKKALDHIDKIIALIKKSKDIGDARTGLMKEFKLSEIQSVAILEMKLQKLAGLERKKVENELKEIQKIIEQLESILKSKKKIDEEVIKGVEEVRDAFGDERRTKIVKQKPDELEDEDLIPEKQNKIMISEEGYVKRTTYDEYRKQRRGGVGSKGVDLKDEDFTKISISASSHDNVYFFTNKGKVYQLKSYELPEGKRNTKGRALINFISMDTNERVTSIVPVSKGVEKNSYLFFATKLGIVKKVRLDQFTNIRKTGIIALNIEKNDELVSTMLCTNEDDIIMVSNFGKSIRFTTKELRVLGRSAKGVKGMKLAKDDYIISALTIKNELRGSGRLLTLSEKGFGKQTKLTAFKTQKRGGSGVKASEITTKTGNLVGVHIVDDNEDEIITMSKNGLMVRTGVNEISERGRQTQGVSVMKLKGDDILTASTHM